MYLLHWELPLFKNPNFRTLLLLKFKNDAAANRSSPRFGSKPNINYWLKHNKFKIFKSFWTWILTTSPYRQDVQQALLHWGSSCLDFQQTRTIPPSNFSSLYFCWSKAQNSRQSDTKIEYQFITIANFKTPRTEPIKQKKSALFGLN